MPGRTGIKVSVIAGAVGLFVGVVAPLVAFLVIRGRTPAASGGPPVLALVIILGASVAVAAIFFFMARAARRRMVLLLGAGIALENGVPAQATVLALADTGVTINKNPQVRVELEVRRRDGHSYRAAATAVVSRLTASRYAPGTTVNVMVDPRDPRRVALLGLADAGPSSR
ncbi:MAG: hypothetical protein R6X12_05805 [bacterium]